MKIYKETASVYAKGVPVGSRNSPVKLTVVAQRFTNSAQAGKGEGRLIDVCEEKFEEYFGDEWRYWDRQRGYEHDESDQERHLPLNTKLKWEAYIIEIQEGGDDYTAYSVEANSIGEGVIKW